MITYTGSNAGPFSADIDIVDIGDTAMGGLSGNTNRAQKKLADNQAYFHKILNGMARSLITTFGTAWDTIPATTALKPSYTMLGEKEVHLSGKVSNSTTSGIGVQIARLPSGVRPAIDMYLSATVNQWISAGTSKFEVLPVKVGTDGWISYVNSDDVPGGAGVDFYFDNIKFLII